MKLSPPGIHSARRAFSLVEMIIAMAILSILVVMVFSAMIVYGREFKSIRTQNSLQEQARYLMLRLTFLSATATNLTILDDGNTLRVVFLRTDDDGVQTYHTRDFVFGNGDGKDETLGDNTIREYEVKNGSRSSSYRTLLQYVSKIGSTKVFHVNAKASRQLVELEARAGDRTNPPDREDLGADKDGDVKTALADDAFTGPGYQSFVVRCSLVPAG